MRTVSTEQPRYKVWKVTSRKTDKNVPDDKMSTRTHLSQLGNKVPGLVCSVFGPPAARQYFSMSCQCREIIRNFFTEIKNVPKMYSVAQFDNTQNILFLDCTRL